VQSELEKREEKARQVEIKNKKKAALGGRLPGRKDMSISVKEPIKKNEESESSEDEYTKNMRTYLGINLTMEQRALGAEIKE
jgi:hypothetical protein